MKQIVLILMIFCSSLLAQNDTLYAFRTTNNKIVQFLYNDVDSIFTYQFISSGIVELEVVDDLKDQDTVITVDGYYRGGGCQNSHMDYNTVIFSNGDARYEVYYYSGPSEEECIEDPNFSDWDSNFGITVYVDDREIDIKGKEVLIGEVYGWSFTDILPNKRN